MNSGNEKLFSNKKERIIFILISSFCIVLLIGFLLMLNENIDLSKRLNPENNHVHSAECFGEQAGWFIIDGVKYKQNYIEMSSDSVTQMDFLGFLEDFEGLYKNCPDNTVTGGIYTILEDENTLLIHLTNGSSMFFSKVE